MRRLAALVAGGLALLASGCGGSTTAPGGSTASPSVPSLGSLSSSGAGHRFYEIYDPVGTPRGTMLLVHGGGWTDSRGDARKDETQTALALHAQGWRVINISYSPGFIPAGHPIDPRPMLRDVVAFYDQARRAYGGPMCALGDSAGGHLVAMLALERPSLTCAILDVAPLDLRTMLELDTRIARSPQSQGFPKLAAETGVNDVIHTFGTSPSLLAQWSPTLLWRPANNATKVFATDGSSDTTVPAQQLTAFQAKDPGVNAQVLQGAPPGSPGSLYFFHSFVVGTAYEQRLTSLISWLDGLAPRTPETSAPTDTGTGCDVLPAGADRYRLMLAGDAWQQSSTAGAIEATRGCSGSGAWQDDGLSLWAAPGPGAVLPAGGQASLTLDAGHAVRNLSVAFRGFFTRPQDWALGLFASNQASGPVQTPVAGCTAGRCSGLRLLPAGNGVLLTPSGSTGNSDQSDQPPSASFTLPAGTRRIAWVLRCVAPTGCALAGATNAAGISTRPRDPLGQPAIFSIYRAAVS